MRRRIDSRGVMSPIGLVMLIALAFILGGLYIASTGSPGTGLMVVGVGVLIGGFGGSAPKEDFYTLVLSVALLSGHVKERSGISGFSRRTA